MHMCSRSATCTVYHRLQRGQNSAGRAPWEPRAAPQTLRLGCHKIRCHKVGCHKVGCHNKDTSLPLAMLLPAAAETTQAPDGSSLPGVALVQPTAAAGLAAAASHAEGQHLHCGEGLPHAVCGTARRRRGPLRRRVRVGLEARRELLRPDQHRRRSVRKRGTPYGGRRPLETLNPKPGAHWRPRSHPADRSTFGFLEKWWRSSFPSLRDCCQRRS